MCQRNQKSMMLEAFKGESKLGGSFTPKQRLNPMAMSLYPEKSK